MLFLCVNTYLMASDLPTKNKEVLNFKGDKTTVRKVRKKTTNLSKQVVNHETMKFATVSTLFSDPFNVIKILPGVVNNGSFSAQMYIRGGGGNEVLTVQDNHYFQYPYFWGGRVSIINPKLVDDITFYSGGFPARYGQMLSGVIDVKTINGSTKENHFELDQSLTELNWLAHGPIIENKLSWLVSVRRTYYDYIMNALIPDNTLVPFYESYSTKFFYQFSPKHSLTYFLQNFHDHGDVKAKGKDTFGAIFNFDTNIWAHQLNVNSNWNEKWSSELSLQAEDLRVYFNKFDQAPVRFSDKESPKAGLFEWVYRGKQNHIVRFGGLGWAQQFTRLIDITVPPNAEYATPATTNVYLSGSGKVYYTSAYIEDEWVILPKKMSLNMGLRTDKVLNSYLTNMQTFQPRVILYLGDRDSKSFTVSTGRYQMMDFRVQDSTVVNLKPNEALHYNVGFEQKNNIWFSRVELFYKDYKNLTNEIADETGAFQGYDNNQKGHSEGIELFLQRKESEKWHGSLSYTLSNVNYNNSHYGNYYPDHDQRHTLNILGAYKVTDKWTIISKAIFHSGKPYTNIENGTFNDSLRQYLPVLGEHNNSRYPHYATVDISARYKKDKLFFKRYDGEIYLGLANVFNSKNILSYEWSSDYRDRQAVYDISRLPIFGLSMKF